MPQSVIGIQDSSVLVTGAAGFLGSVILTSLRKLGVRAVGTARSASPGITPPVISLNLQDRKSFSLLDAMGPYDAVVHCAAELPGKRSDLELMISNITMTYNVMEWAINAGVDYLCFASGCNVYGFQSTPCTEDTPPAPPECYGISKLSCEHMIRVLFPKASLLRISAPYGPGLRAETVIKRFLKLAACNETIVLLGTGAREQHFVYEEDVAHAVSLALAARTAGIFNVSGVSPISMRDLAECVLGIFGRNVELSIRMSGVDPQESFRGHFPSDAANQSLGYRPQIDLECGLRLCAGAWGLL